MIEVIEGFGLGSGKSYYVVTRLIEHWKQGGTACVCDTMVIHWEKVKDYVKRSSGYVLQDQQFETFSQDNIHRLFEHTLSGGDDIPVVIVIDEAQGKLNARDWADKSKRELFDWACQSRHDNNDLWFISQSSNNVDKQVRRLATFVWRVRNTARWGGNIITHFLKAVSFLSAGWHTGAYFIVTQLDQDGRTVLGRRKWLDQDREIFACYESKAMRGLRKRKGIAVGRIQLERHKGRIPWVRWAIACGLVGLCVVGCSRIFHSSAPPKQEVTAVKESDKKEKPKGPYGVRVEAFRNQLGNHILTTDKWIYEKGTLSPDGIVTDILDGQAKIKQIDGRFLFVVTDRHNNSNSGDVVRVQSESPKIVDERKTVVAKDHGLFPPVSSPFPRETVSYEGSAVGSASPTATPSPVAPVRR